ncbi:MAG: hypothetical protein N3D17_05990 [bacterium]|nr:hypothetical protein [bacterium]
MGRHKNEIKKLHRKKIKKAKEKLKEFEAKKIPFRELNRLAKKIFCKRLHSGYEISSKTS